MCWYIYDHNLSTLVVKIMVARFLLAKKHVPLVMILSLYIQNIQADICADVPEGSCLVGEFFDADTGACKTCSFNRTSCGGGVGEDGCRCAGNGGFNGTVAEVTVVPQIKGTVECVDPSGCPGTYDGSGFSKLEWLSSKFLLALDTQSYYDRASKSIYCFDTETMPHTKTTFATPSEAPVDFTVDSDNNIVYAILCVDSETEFSELTCKNNGYLTAFSYNPASCTVTSSHIVTQSGTRKEFSKLSTLVVLKSAGALLLMPITGGPVQEVTMNADRITIYTTKEHSLGGISTTYVATATLDPDGTSVWFFSINSGEFNNGGMNKIDTTKTDWEVTTFQNLFTTGSVHYPRASAISASGVMYVGGYNRVVQDNLDGTGEILAGSTTAGWGESWGSLDQFFEVFGVAVSHDGAFVYTGSKDRPSLKRVATGLPATTTVHAPKCSCVQDAVSSAGNLSGFCVGCPSENMTSPAEEDTCACKPEFFSNIELVANEYENPYGAESQKTTIARLSNKPTAVAFAHDNDYLWVVEGNNLKQIQISTGTTQKDLSSYDGGSNFYGVKKITPSGTDDDHVFILQSNQIRKIQISTQTSVNQYSGTYMYEFDISSDGSFLIAVRIENSATSVHRISTTDLSNIATTTSEGGVIRHPSIDRDGAWIYLLYDSISSPVDPIYRIPADFGYGYDLAVGKVHAADHNGGSTRSMALLGNDILYLAKRTEITRIDFSSNSFRQIGSFTKVEQIDVSRDGTVISGVEAQLIDTRYNVYIVSTGLTTTEFVNISVCKACPAHSSTRYASHRPITETGSAEDCVCDAGYTREVNEVSVLQTNPWGDFTETIVWGLPGTTGYVDDADPANVRFSYPSRVSFRNGLSNNFYVHEMAEKRIRKIDLSTRSTSTELSGPTWRELNGVYTAFMYFVEMAPDGTLYGGQNQYVKTLNADYSLGSTVYTFPVISNGWRANNNQNAGHGVFSANGKYMFLMSTDDYIHFVVLNLQTNSVEGGGPHQLYEATSFSDKCDTYGTQMVLSSDEKTVYYNQPCGGNYAVKKIDSCHPEHYSSCNPSPVTLYSHSSEQIAGIALYEQNTLLLTHFNQIKKIDLSVQPYTVETFMEGSFTGEGNRYAYGGLAVSPDNLFLVTGRSTHNVRLHSLGHWSELQNISQCSPCDIGWYSNGSLGASCQPCSVGTTAAPGAGTGPEDCRCDFLSENSVVSSTGDFCTCPSDAFFVDTQTVYDEIPNEHGPLGQTVTQYESSDTDFVYHTDYKTALSQDGQFMYLRSYTNGQSTLARFNLASQQIQHLFYDDGPYTNFFLTNNDKYVWFEDYDQGLFQLDVETLVTEDYSEWDTTSHPAIVNRFIFPSSPRSWGNADMNKWCVSGDGKLIALMWILDSPKRVTMEVRNSSNFDEVLYNAEKPLYTTYSLGSPRFFQFGPSNEWLYYGGFAKINDETRDLRYGKFHNYKYSFFLYRVPVTLEGFADTSTRLVRTNDYNINDKVEFAAVSPDEKYVYFYGSYSYAIYRAPIQSPFADPIAERVTYGGDDNDIDGDATTAQFYYFKSLYVSTDQTHLIVLNTRSHKIKYVSTGPAFVPRSINHCRACPAHSSTQFPAEQDVNLGGSVADCVCSNNLLMTEADTVVPVTVNAAGPAGQTTTPVTTTLASIDDIVIIPGQNKAFVKEETTDLHVLDLDTGDYSVAMSGLPHWSTGSVMCLSHDGSKVHAFNAYAASSSAAKWGYFTTQPPYEFVQDKNNLKAVLNTQIYVADDGSQEDMIGKIKKCLETIDGNLILLVDSSPEFLVHYNVESNVVTPLVSEKGPVKLDVYDAGDVFHLPGEGKFGFQVYDSGYHWYMYDLCTSTATLIFAPTSRHYAMVADATERFFYGVHYSYIDRINATSYETTRLAGSSTYGNTDGTADEATFKDNNQVALSEDGQYLLIAQNNEKRIRKVSLGAFAATMQTLTQCVSKTCRAHASWREGISEVESLETNCVCDAGYVKTHGLCEFCPWTCESCPLHTYSNGSVGATCEPCPVGGTLAGVPAGSADECLCENLDPNFRLDNASGTCVCIESYTQGPILVLKNETTPDFFSTLPYQDDQRCYPCQPGLIYSNAFDHCVCENSAEYPVNATVQREDKEFVLGPVGTVRTFNGLPDFDSMYDDYYNPQYDQHPVVFEPGSSLVILGGHGDSSGDKLYRKNIFDGTTQYETLLTDFTKIKDICVPPLHLWTEQQQNVVVLDHSTVYIVNLATLPLSKTNLGDTPNPANGCTVGDDGSIWVADRYGRLLKWEYDGTNWQKNLDLNSYIYFNMVPDPVNGGFLTFQYGTRLVRVVDNQIHEIWEECTYDGQYTLDYDADDQCPYGSIGPWRQYDSRNTWRTTLHLALHPDHQYVYVSTSNVIRRLRVDDESYQLTTPFGPYTVQTNGAATITRGTADGTWNEARFNLITSIAISADGSTLVVMDDGNMRLISLGKTLDVPAAACVACPLHQFVPVAEQYAYTDFQTEDVCACRAGMQKITTPDTGTDIATGKTCAAGTYFAPEPDSLAYAGNPPASKWSHTGRQDADTWRYGQISCPAIDNENDSFGSVGGVPICFQWGGGSLTLELEAPSTVVGFNIIRVHSDCYVRAFSVLYSLDNVNWQETPCQKCTEYGCNPYSTTDHHCRYSDNNFEYPVIAKYVKFQTLHGVNDRNINYGDTCDDRHVVGTVDVRLDPCFNCPALLTSLPNRQGLESCFGDSCIACPAGKVSFEPSNLNTCYSCGVGKTANEERTACLCMNGYVTDGLTCTKCDEGTEGDFAGGCRACAPGSYSQHEWTWFDTTDAVPGSTKLCPVATRDCSYVETLSWAGADATQRHTQQITTGLGSMTVQTGALAAWADDESTTDNPIALFSSDPAEIFRLQYSVDGVAVGLNATLPGAWLVVTFEHPIQLHNYDLHALCDLGSIACDHLTVHYYAKSKADTFWHPVHSGASIDMLAVRVTDVQATALQTTSVTVDGGTVEITYLSIRMLNVAGLTQQTPPVCRPCGVTRFSSGAGAAACASCAPFAYSDTRNGQACDHVCFDGEEPAGTSSCQACAAGKHSSVPVLYRPEQTQFPESVLGNTSEAGRTEVTTGTGTYVLSYDSKNTGGLGGPVSWAPVQGPYL